jgi:branched-chain amino acid transport system ATP-binding protein
MLEIRDLRAGYGGTEVLRGVSLDVNAGEVVAVLGSNGVGKTTLNKVLSGVVPATAGTIRFNGAALEHAGAPEIVTAGLIHVPEGRKIFPNLSVRENLELGAYCRPRRGRGERIEQIYAIFPKLRQRARQYAGTLSGGEQQMLAIGRGLMGEPKLLILDEPSLGLSPLMVEEMFALIARLAASGLAIMLVEQNVVQSLELAGRAYIMENGLITLSGPASDLKSNAELKRAYLGL